MPAILAFFGGGGGDWLKFFFFMFVKSSVAKPLAEDAA